jgi:hypothetical protein
MGKLTDLQLVKDVRAKLADPNSWVQYKLAVDKDNNTVWPEDKKAIKWCLVGAADSIKGDLEIEGSYTWHEDAKNVRKKGHRLASLLHANIYSDIKQRTDDFNRGSYDCSTWCWHPVKLVGEWNDKIASHSNILELLDKTIQEIEYLEQCRKEYGPIQQKLFQATHDYKIEGTIIYRAPFDRFIDRLKDICGLTKV